MLGKCDFNEAAYRDKLIEGGINPADAADVARKTAEAKRGTHLVDALVAEGVKHKGVHARGLVRQGKRTAVTKADDLLGELAAYAKPKGTLASLNAHCEKAWAAAEVKRAETPVQMFLPGFDIGAFPNHLNRSSFIAPVARGQRKFHRQAVMVTRRDCVLEYTGEQLDEADGDLIMALIAFAQPHPLGTPVPLNRKELLRKIKRGSIGTTQYDWLHRSMKRLREGTLFLEARKPDGSTRYTVGKMESFNILKGLNYDGDSETYTYVLDPRWMVMFGNREYGLIDWDKRMMIGRGQDMAKTLQRLLSTSADSVQRYALDWLKPKMEYSGRVRDFLEALARAVHELERLEIIAQGRIEDSTKGKPQLVLWRLPVA